MNKLINRLKTQKPIIWDNIVTVDIPKFTHEKNNQPIKSLLEKLAVVKLNGGLGTSMGCKNPKSLC